MTMLMKIMMQSMDGGGVCDMFIYVYIWFVNPFESM